jgi:hypothetical protein
LILFGATFEFFGTLRGLLRGQVFSFCAISAHKLLTNSSSKSKRVLLWMDLFILDIAIYTRYFQNSKKQTVPQFFLTAGLRNMAVEDDLHDPHLA